MYVLGAEEKLFWEETYVLCSAVPCLFPSLYSSVNCSLYWCLLLLSNAKQDANKVISQKY